MVGELLSAPRPTASRPGQSSPLARLAARTGGPQQDTASRAKQFAATHQTGGAQRKKNEPLWKKVGGGILKTLQMPAAAIWSTASGATSSGVQLWADLSGHHNQFEGLKELMHAPNGESLFGFSGYYTPQQAKTDIGNTRVFSTDYANLGSKLAAAGDKSILFTNPAARIGVSIVGDVATDPLTYLAPEASLAHGGSGAVAAHAAEAAGVASRAARGLRGGEIVAETAADAEKALQGVTYLSDADKLRAGTAAAKGLRPSDEAIQAAAELESKANRLNGLAQKAGTGRMGAGLTKSELQEVMGESVTGGLKLNAPGTGAIGRRLGVAKLLDREAAAARMPSQLTLLERNALTAAPGRLMAAGKRAASATKLGDSVANALGGADEELRRALRTSNDPNEWADAFLGRRAKRMGRLTQAGLEKDLFKMTKEGLRDVHGKVPDETIVGAMRGDPAAVQALSELPGGQRAMSLFEEMRLKVNNRAGFEMIPRRENYFPRLVTDTEGNISFPEMGKVFNKAGIEKQAVKPGETFLGKLIEEPGVAGKTVERQMEEAIQAAGPAAGKLNNNLAEGVAYWIRQSARRAGEEHARDLMVKWDVARDGVAYVGNSKKIRLVASRNAAEAQLAGLNESLSRTQGVLDDLTGATKAREFGALASASKHEAGVANQFADEIEHLVAATEARVALTRQAVANTQKQTAAAQTAVEGLRAHVRDLTMTRDALLEGWNPAAHGAAETGAKVRAINSQLDQASAHLKEILNNPLVVESNMRSIIESEKEAQYAALVAAQGDDRLVARVVESLPDDLRSELGATVGAQNGHSDDPLRDILHEYSRRLQSGADDASAQLRLVGRPVPSQAEAENIRKYLPRYRDQVSSQAEIVAQMDPEDVGFYDQVKKLGQAQQQSNDAHMAMEMYDLAQRRLPADEVLRQDRIVNALATDEGVIDLLANRRLVLKTMVENPEQYVNGDAGQVAAMFDQAASSFSPAGLRAMMDNAVGGMPEDTARLMLDAQQYAAVNGVPMSEALDAAMFAGPGEEIDMAAYRIFKENLAQVAGVPVQSLPPQFSPSLLREVFSGQPLQTEIKQLERTLGYSMSRANQHWDRMVNAMAAHAQAQTDLEDLAMMGTIGEGAMKKMEAARWLESAAGYRKMAHDALQAGVIDLKDPTWMEQAAQRAELEGKLHQLGLSVTDQNKKLANAVMQLGKTSQEDGWWRKLVGEGYTDFGAQYWQHTGAAPMPERVIQVQGELAEALAQSTKMVGANSQFLRYWNSWTQMWKRGAILYPGFTVRNIFGGIYNNWLANVAGGSWHDISRGLRSWGDPAKMAELADKDPKLARFMEVWNEAGGISGGQTAAEISSTHLFPNAATRVNPFGVDFAPVAGMRRFNTWAEDRIRGAMAWDTMSREWDTKLGDFADGAMQRAVDRVDKFQFDYGDLSGFEQGVMRRTVMPFYTWARKNLPLQFEMFVMNPAKATRYFKIKSIIEKQSTPDDVVPPYLDDLFSIRLPFKVDGGAGHMYYMPDLPVKDAFTAFDWKYWVGAVNPLIKTPIELAAGTRIQTQLPFKDTYTEAPGAWAAIPGLLGGLQGLGLAQTGDDGNFYLRDRDAYIVEQAMPILGRIRRLVPTEERYQARGLSAWLSFIGVSTRANTQDEQDLYASINRSDERAKQKALKQLPRALGGLKG